MSRKVPVTIRGVTYGSIAEAAAALKVCPSAVSQANARGRLDSVANPLANKRGHSGIPVTVDGTHYPSKLAACEALGLRYQDLQYILEGQGDV